MKKIAALFIFLFAYSTLNAQSFNATTYNNNGFFANASILGAAWNIDNIDEESESGAGLGLKIGYNFNPNFGIFTAFDAASITDSNGESYLLGHFDLGAQGIFRSTSDRVRPLVKASLTGMSAIDGDVQINGAGVGLGVGALISLTEVLALDINYTHGLINISEVKVESQTFEMDESANTGRFFIGLTYYFN